jgi:hypothetical protein
MKFKNLSANGPDNLQCSLHQKQMALYLKDWSPTRNNQAQQKFNDFEEMETGRLQFEVNWAKS